MQITPIKAARSIKAGIRAKNYVDTLRVDYYDNTKITQIDAICIIGVIYLPLSLSLSTSYLRGPRERIKK